MKFDIWHYWIMAAFLFFVLEVFIPGFIMGSIGLGCLLATLGALFNLPLWFNVVLFILGFFVGITMLKPLLERLETTNNVKTNADGLIGRTGKVCEAINAYDGTGRVHVDGDDWKAVSCQIIEVGTLVEIVALESIVVTVRPLVKDNVSTSPKPSESTIADTLNSNNGLIVSMGNKKEVVRYDDILCFYTQQKMTYLVNSEGRKMMLDESLEKLEDCLQNPLFFRANRQFIISAHAVQKYQSKSDGKIEIILKPLSNIPDSISVSRLKAHAFRKWIEKQV